MVSQPSVRAWEGQPLGPAPASATVEPARCGICDHDRSTPVAVGQEFGGPGRIDTFQVVRCDDCGLLYLDPRPPAAPGPAAPPGASAVRGEQSWPAAGETERRLHGGWFRRWVRGLHPAARALAVDGGDGDTQRALRAIAPSSWRVDAVAAAALAAAAVRPPGLPGAGAAASLPAAASCDLAVVAGALERVPGPRALLRAIRAALVPGGRLVVLAQNAATPEFALFGGRHWSGYDVPHRLNVFTPATLTRMAAAVGLEVVALATAADAAPWFGSVANLVADWHGPRPALALASRPPAPLRALVGAVAAAQAAVGRGAVLRALLRRPLGDVPPAGRRPRNGGLS